MVGVGHMDGRFWLSVGKSTGYEDSVGDSHRYFGGYGIGMGMEIQSPWHPWWKVFRYILKHLVVLEFCLLPVNYLFYSTSLPVDVLRNVKVVSATVI